MGDHSNCCHPQKTKGRIQKAPLVLQDFEIWQKGVDESFYKKKLQTFFDDTAEIIRESSYKFSTSCCESLNAFINTLVPKRIDFRSSYSARTAIAIGRTNDPHFDERVIDAIASDISFDSRNLLLRMQKERNDMKDLSRTKTEKYRRKIEKISKQRITPKYSPSDYKDG